MICLVFIGQFSDPVHIAGAGVAASIVNVFLYSIGFGIDGAIETEASQAIGAGSPQLAGIALNSGRLMTTLFFIPIVAVMLFLEDILLLLGQDEEVASVAG